MIQYLLDEAPTPIILVQLDTNIEIPSSMRILRERWNTFPRIMWKDVAQFANDLDQLSHRLSQEANPAITIDTNDPGGNAPDFLCRSSIPQVQAGLKVLRHVAPLRYLVVLQGQTGSGKTSYAKEIWRLGCPGYPFVDFQCASFSPDLVRSELFGYKKGSHDTAYEDTPGPCKLVGKGLLCVEDIDDFPLEYQGHFLKLVEERKFKPVGPDAREEVFEGSLVVTTKVDLGELVRAGRLRSDLYHRLDVIKIVLLPLDERKDDFEDLVALLMEKHKRHNPNMQDLPTKLIHQLKKRSWPGGIRELEREVEQRMVFGSDMWDTYKLAAGKVKSSRKKNQ